MINLYFGRFISIVEGQGEAGDTGMIHLHMSIVVGQRPSGGKWKDTSSFLPVG